MIHARHRICLFRATVVVVTAAWAVFAALIGLMLFNAAVEYTWTPSRLWISDLFPMRMEVVDAVRLLVLAALPAGAVVMTAAGRGWRWWRPEEWRPVPVLAGWIALMLLYVVLLLALRRVVCGHPLLLYYPCLAATKAAVLGVWAAALGLLLRRLVHRLGPLGSWDSGALLIVLFATWLLVGTLAEAVSMADLSDGVSFPRHYGYAVLHWLAVVAVAGVAWRWLAERVRNPTVRMIAAVGLALASGVLVLGESPHIPFESTLLLLMATGLHSLWRWTCAPAE